MKKMSKRKKLNTIAASIAACVLLTVSPTVVYAADVGGIQRTVQLWIHGNQTEVAIDFSSDGSYQMQYADGEGNNVQAGGGGVAIESDGSERPLTEAEIMDHLDDPDVRYEEDGSVWIYYYDQKIDITDKFDDGVCYVQLTNGEETLYMTIKYQNGWSISPHKYASPNSFN